ncbi:MAG: PSD1 and planctomycete cytochrome C domain-containing protein [Planctomycetales bacterium]
MPKSILLIGVAWSLLGQAVFGGEPTPEQIEFFEKRIRPLLVMQCAECHGEGAAKGGLRLVTGESTLRGGDSGPAVIAGKPEQSLLIEAVEQRGDIKMPPKSKLSETEIADLRRWVEIGAPWPAEADDAKVATAPFVITDEQRHFWSFQPIRTPPTPNVQHSDWPVGAIDRFILSALEQQGLTPSPPADRRTLIRRLTFDLIGLPPTPEAVQAFEADDRADAWERLIERLLASPQYGERWGRYWLDVARYAEDQAHTFQARMYPSGYRYRDWVIRSFNRDLPYDQFVREQIAGDLLDGPPEEQYDRQIALGYFALGPVYYADAGCAFKASQDELDDRLDTLSRGFLGLTLACARCHDHKFDPISQRDYYALAGVFRSTTYREAPLVEEDVVRAYDAGQQAVKQEEQALKKFLEGEGERLAELAARQSAKYLTALWQWKHPAPGAPAPKREDLAKQSGLFHSILERWEKSLVPEQREMWPALALWFELEENAQVLTVHEGVAVPAEVAAAAAAFETQVVAALAERETRQQAYAQALAAASEAEKSQIPKPALEKPQADLLAAVVGPKGVCAIPTDKVEGLLDPSRQPELVTHKLRLEEQKKAAPPKYAMAHAVSEGEAANMKLHIRGNPNRTGEEVPRRFLEILSPQEPLPLTQGSGRAELARAVASPNNPLTPRVIVNRLWQQHFGRGLVATPSNFGRLGERPSHPELLDYLAARLIRNGWSIKQIHREIVCSATYRQTSAVSDSQFERDPDNLLLSRMPRRRLDVEAWRDALLSVAGHLDQTPGGPSGNLATAEFRRRTVYGAVSRHNLDGLLRLFDFPDPNITSERRAVTTVPLQQLFVLNSDFMAAQARALAARLAAEAGSDDRARIERGYRLLVGRLPSPVEIEIGLEFLASAETAAESIGGTGAAGVASLLSRWEQYAQVLLSANEFAFVD